MAVYKEEKTNTWRVIYRYMDWTGERKQSQKRGFKTKREALAWEREQLNKATADLDMTFASFVEQYTADMKTRIKENTWATKDHIIRTKLLPYWCGIREGELLALTPADFDFEKCTVSITKSYQRLNGQDLITTPKTEKSNRVIKMPQFLADEMQDYLKQLYGIEPNDRMFAVTKSYLHREMDRGAKEAGVKRIRIHDIRHSAVSLLIDMGFSATAIADRVGHESIDITYNYGDVRADAL